MHRIFGFCFRFFFPKNFLPHIQIISVFELLKYRASVDQPNASFVKKKKSGQFAYACVCIYLMRTHTSACQDMSVVRKKKLHSKQYRYEHAKSYVYFCAHTMLMVEARKQFVMLHDCLWLKRISSHFFCAFVRSHIKCLNRRKTSHLCSFYL